VEPKFQSTFIPKGQTLSGTGTVVTRRRERSLLGFIGALIFTCSVLVALGAYGYGYYLKTSIVEMAKALETGRAQLDPEAVSELISLNNRIVSTADLIGSHVILSPFFKFLEATTLKTVRFTYFDYKMGPQALEVTLRGEAQNYTALAQQADVLNKSGHLSKIIFSDLTLNEKGNVIFSLSAAVDSRLLSYQRTLEAAGSPARQIVPAVSTSTSATTTPRTTTTGATTTRATGSSTTPR
jgi:hypothetical protein